MPYKDFTTWHHIKSQLNHAKFPDKFFYEKEIWWAAVGLNIRFEEDGKGKQFARPVIILRKFSKDLFWGIPLSSTPKTGPYYYHFRYRHDKNSTALLSQLKTYDANRLIDKEGALADIDYITLQGLISQIINRPPRK